MNYQRIYSSFIGSRRALEAGLTGYTEKHHVVPRSLGGSDAASNLIALTPEDHYFAHCCLAKMHGGKLWSALFLMSGNRRYNKRGAIVGKRALYGAARRHHILIETGKDGLKGSDNGNYNPLVHEWRNLDTGAKRSATLHEMWAEFGSDRGSWTAVQTGDRKTIAGWTIEGRDIRIRGLKGKVQSFINADGRSFVGTQDSFCKMAGLSAASATRVCRHQSVTLCGWRLSGTIDRVAYYGKDGTPIRQDKGETFRLLREGVELSGTRRKIAEELGSNAASVSAAIYAMKNGKVKTYKGWRYAGKVCA